MGYGDWKFEEALGRALEDCRKVLATTRHPQRPADVDHLYEDKFTLVQWSIKGGAAAQLALLRRLGTDDNHLTKMLAWRDEGRSLTLEWSWAMDIKFKEKVDVDVPSNTRAELKNSFLGKTSLKMVTIVPEFLWDLASQWELAIVAGTGESSAIGASEKLVICGGQGEMQVKTATEQAPYLGIMNEKLELRLDWLFERIVFEGSNTKVEFSIDRMRDECKTPRRNRDVDGALMWGKRAMTFFFNVHVALKRLCFPLPEQDGYKQADIMNHPPALFSPVLALFCFEEGGDSGKGPFLAAGDWPHFEAEMMRKIEEATKECFATASSYKANKDVVAIAAAPNTSEYNATATNDLPANSVLTQALCDVFIVCHQMQRTASDVVQCVEHVEMMLAKQLTAAIGKTLAPNDFTEYMRHHNRLLFQEKYRPVPFCHAVRRPGYSPEGTVALQALGGGANSELETTVRHAEAQRPMHFELSSSCSVSFLGERYVHAAVLHQFSDSPHAGFELVASARQFSFFVLMVGSIASADLFKPSAALIIKNQDELRMPLEVTTVPTAKEFKHAIESLSPEQQEFCNAFRGLQLSSTLFGVLVVQIKPQMERLLNLPADALTKEIALTQDLMELFITFQIPADLISFNGDPGLPLSDKLSFIKEHVASIRTMIKSAQEDELAQQKALAEKAKQEERTRRAGASNSLGGGYAVEHDEIMYKSKLNMKKGDIRSKSRSGGGSGVFQSPPQVHMLMNCAMPSFEAADNMEMEMETGVGFSSSSQAVDIAENATDDIPNKNVTYNDAMPTDDGGAEDYTLFPKFLDKRSDRFDMDAALRPTIIKPGGTWTKQEKAGLLSARKMRVLNTEDQEDAKCRAFDLLDALSRSGALPCDNCELHVICASTHSFDKTLFNVLLEDNVNPISKVERSSLIVASTLHSLPAASLVHPTQLAHLKESCPLELLDIAP